MLLLPSTVAAMLRTCFRRGEVARLERAALRLLSAASEAPPPAASAAPAAGPRHAALREALREAPPGAGLRSGGGPATSSSGAAAAAAATAAAGEPPLAPAGAPASPPAPVGAGRVHVETYGCQMNVNDSEILTAILRASGYVTAAGADDADVILLNTCAIRENAEAKIWGRLALLKAAKAAAAAAGRAPPVVGVLGCMAERLKEKLLDSARCALFLGRRNARGRGLGLEGGGWRV